METLKDTENTNKFEDVVFSLEHLRDFAKYMADEEAKNAKASKEDKRFLRDQVDMYDTYLEIFREGNPEPSDLVDVAELLTDEIEWSMDLVNDAFKNKNFEWLEGIAFDLHIFSLAYNQLVDLQKEGD